MSCLHELEIPAVNFSTQSSLGKKEFLGSEVKLIWYPPPKFKFISSPKQCVQIWHCAALPALSDNMNTISPWTHPDPSKQMKCPFPPAADGRLKDTALPSGGHFFPLIRTRPTLHLIGERDINPQEETLSTQWTILIHRLLFQVSHLEGKAGSAAKHREFMWQLWTRISMGVAWG